MIDLIYVVVMVNGRYLCSGKWESHRRDEQNNFEQLLEIPAMSVGVYQVPKGGVDDQVPHREDEVYVVLQGVATLNLESGSRKVIRGDVIFVPAGEEHRFEGIEEDLRLLVIFAPAYSGR